MKRGESFYPLSVRLGTLSREPATNITALPSMSHQTKKMARSNERIFDLHCWICKLPLDEDLPPKP